MGVVLTLSVSTRAGDGIALLVFRGYERIVGGRAAAAAAAKARKSGKSGNQETILQQSFAPTDNRGGRY